MKRTKRVLVGKRVCNGQRVAFALACVTVLFCCVLFAGTVMGATCQTDLSDRDTRELIFATPVNQSVFTRYLRDVFREISRRTGLACRIVELPGARCLVEANRGDVDGVPARIAGLASDGYAHLLRLHTPIYTVEHIVFLNREHVPNVHDLQTLLQVVRNKNLVVAYSRGSMKASSLLAELPEKNRVPLEAPEQAFMMLSRNRIAAYLAGPGLVSKVLLNSLQNKPECRESMKHIVPAFVVSRTQLFPYVNKKNRDLVNTLEGAMCSMQADGTLKRLQMKCFETVCGE
ncbi:substrate-binding periplasmic protein [Desulfoplanes formicivorans]|uniref:Solute-binding protein family 3/N-terminal domain-containing protein n=1 Tax=Desulfoplanes formicivorans TaxID=1592317 RepID=A0A194AMK0_9BACT|nr:transporter substrate-binding domain-containing protein [Desulfoplanes formicivorans]GAU09854.1 hypothetical protein DPF_2590 [Desulfoplanes formicivorans]